MRILFLNHNLRGRGSWFRCWHFARYLARRDHKITLITAAPGPQWAITNETIEGVQVITTPRWAPLDRHDGGYGCVDLVTRTAWTLTHRYDVVHAFEHRPNVVLPALTSWSCARQACVVDWSDWWCRGGILAGRRPWQWLDSLEATVLEEGFKRRWAHAVTVVSECLWSRCEQVGIPTSRLDLIPSGCDPDQIVCMDRAQARQQLGWDQQWQVIGFAGFAVWDIELLVKAFASIAKENPSARLCIIGHDKDHQLPGLLQRHLTNPEQVILTGIVPYEQLGEHFSACQVLALPMADTLANQARWPIKFGDYLSAGRAIVMNNVGDCAKVLDSAQAGWVSSLSAEGFAACLREALQNPEEADRRGQRGRELALGNFHWQHRAKQLEALYQRVFER